MTTLKLHVLVFSGNFTGLAVPGKTGNALATAWTSKSLSV